MFCAGLQAGPPVVIEVKLALQLVLGIVGGAAALLKIHCKSFLMLVPFVPAAATSNDIAGRGADGTNIRKDKEGVLKASAATARMS